MQCHVSLTSLTFSITALFLRFFLFLLIQNVLKKTFLNSIRFAYLQTYVNISVLGSFKLIKNWYDAFVDVHFMHKIMSGIYTYEKLACNQIEKILRCIC